MSRLHRARLGGAHFSAEWPWAQLCWRPAPRSLPSLKEDQKARYQKAMPRYFGLQRPQKFSKRISGFSTMNSREFRTVKNQTAVEISLTTTRWRNWTATWISTSTTTRRTSELILHFSTPTFPRKARSRSVWNSFERCPAAPPPARAGNFG